MDAITDEVVAALEQERASLRRTLDGLASAGWDRATGGNEAWTVRDAVAHLTGSDRSMVALLTAIAGGAYSLEEAKAFRLDEFNARQVARRRELPVGELRSEMDANREALLEVVRRLAGDVWAAPVWWPGFSGGEGRTLPLRERMLGYAAHDASHAEQIASAPAS